MEQRARICDIDTSSNDSWLASFYFSSFGDLLPNVTINILILIYLDRKFVC